MIRENLLVRGIPHERRRIDVTVDWSLLIIFALITVGLGSGASGDGTTRLGMQQIRMGGRYADAQDARMGSVLS